VGREERSAAGVVLLGGIKSAEREKRGDGKELEC